MKPQKRIQQVSLAKGSKGRQAAKRKLPALLLKFRRSRDAVSRRAKRPGLLRLVQRERRLAAMAAAKEAARLRRESLAGRLGIKQPEAA